MFRPWSHFGTLRAAAERLANSNSKGAIGTAWVYRVSISPANALEIKDPRFSGAMPTIREVIEVLTKQGWDEARAIHERLSEAEFGNLNHDWAKAREARWDAGRAGSDTPGHSAAVGREAEARRKLGEFEERLYPELRKLLGRCGFDALQYKNEKEDRGSISVVSIDSLAPDGHLAVGPIKVDELVGDEDFTPAFAELVHALRTRPFDDPGNVQAD